MTIWTPQHEEKLRELWAKGWTGTEIAEALPPLQGSSAKPPRKVNRDMVIAKARRMKLPPRGSPIGQRLYG